MKACYFFIKIYVNPCVKNKNYIINQIMFLKAQAITVSNSLIYGWLLEPRQI